MSAAPASSASPGPDAGATPESDPHAGVPPPYRPAPGPPEPAGTGDPGAGDPGAGDPGLTDRRREATEEKSGRRRRLEYPPAPEPLPVPVVDNHAHLDFRDGLVTVEVHQAMDAAAAVGISGAVQVGCDLDSARFTIEAIEAEPRLLGAVAIHPNDAARLAGRDELEPALTEIAQLAEHPRVRSVGESGLDYFRTGADGVAAQQESFRWHIGLAARLGKALQVHDRDAHEDVVRILREADELPPHVVFHCFSGDAELARICNEHGWMMSFAGPVTFKNNDALRAALAEARPELVLVETDSPFLTPHPWRGRPNAPYLVPLTLRTMAEVRGVEVGRLAEQLQQNTTRVYGQF